ncbi:MAG: hypothetical protein ACKVPX_07350 [Myxococcaceae bacterium]
MTFDHPLSAAPAQPSRLESWGALFLSVLAGGGFVAHALWLQWPVVDDAAISIAFAQTFLEGQGFRATPDSQTVEAFSNPTWTLWLAVGLWSGFSGVAWAKFWGIAFGALATALLGAWPAAAQGRAPEWRDAIAPWLTAAFPSFVAWCASGMEVGLFAFLMTATGAVGLREFRAGRGVWTGVLLGFFSITRPEAPMLAALGGLLWVLAKKRSHRALGRQDIFIAALALLPFFGWSLFRWVHFADFVPNTYWAKRGWDFGRANYLAGFARQYKWLIGMGLLSLPVAGRIGAISAVVAGGLAGFAWSAKGDWMGEWRFLVPAVPALAAAIGAAVSRARQFHGHLGLRLSLAGAVALIGWSTLTQRQRVRALPQLPFAFIAGNFERLKPVIDAMGQKRPLIAFPDLGGQALVLRTAEIIDVAGLADWALAHHSLNRAAQEDYLVSEGVPSFVDIHGPSGHLREMPALMAELQHLDGPIFAAKGLSPTEDPRCPEGKAKNLALDATALLAQLEADVVGGNAPVAIRRWRCAFAYRPDDSLPGPQARAALAQQLVEHSRRSESSGDLQRALRESSLATLLSGGDAHLRRRTEALRERVFPPTEPVASAKPKFDRNY